MSLHFDMVAIHILKFFLSKDKDKDEIRKEGGKKEKKERKKKIKHSIAVIPVDPAIIYSFVKKVCERGERVNTSVKTIQIDPFTLSAVCQTADNYDNSYLEASIAIYA